MNIEKIAVSNRQLALFALLFLAPLAFVWLAQSATQAAAADDSDPAAAWIASVVCVGLAALVIGAMLSRRVVRLSGDALLVKHTFYTFTITRAEADGVTVDQLDSLQQLGVSLKKNGVAGFGFWSGWFRGHGGATIFCAVSRSPFYRFRFDGHARHSQLALSCSHEMAAAIRTWATPAEGSPGSRR